MALTTLANVKLYLGITESTYDSIISEILDAVSDSIEKYCGREFTLANYTTFKVFQSDYGVNLKLRNHPVTRVYGAWHGSTEMVSVDLNAQDTTFYQTYLDTDTLVISAEDGDTTSSFTLTAYDDIEALFDAVVAAYPGFTVTYRAEWYKQLPPQILLPDSYNNVRNEQPGEASFYGAYQPLRLLKVGQRLFRTQDLPDGTPIVVRYQAGYSTIPDSLALICKKVCQGVWERSGQGAKITGAAEREKIGKYEVEETLGASSTKATSSRPIQGLVNGLLTADILTDLDYYRNKDLA